MSQGPPMLGGRYELGDVLGYGGMAEVYFGNDARLGRPVAVKVLRADLARDPAFLSRFRREAQSAAALSHPAIVSVYDTGEDTLEGRRVPFIVMEYVQGRTLREVLQAEGRLLPRRAVEIVAEVCDALEFSHVAGIVHRDIKPGNVMITSTGEVKVMDFGIARAVAASASTVTQTAAVMGTAQYLSPEQARGEHVDARSDIYSTGCLLYELLTGQPPFTGDSPVAVAYQHVREDPVQPSRLDPDISADLDAVVLKAMAKNPANRYQTAAEFGADLQRAAAGRRVLATPVMVAGQRSVMTGPGGRPLVAPPPVAVRTAVPSGPSIPARAGRGVAYLLLIGAVVAVFIVAAIVARNAFDTGQSGTVAAPNLVGLQLTAAQGVLSKDGLSLGTVKHQAQLDPSSAAPSGQVLDQSVTPPFTVNRDSSIDVTVSDGLPPAVIPDVNTQVLADAIANLKKANLVPGTTVTADASPGVPKGTVIKVAPPAGGTVAFGTVVTLTEASGGGTIPMVKGLTFDEAAATLQAAGFQVATAFTTRTVGASAGVAPGLILTTSNLAPGTMAVPYGTLIYLVKAVSPQPTPAPVTVPPVTVPPVTAPPTTTPTPGPTPGPTAGPPSTGPTGGATSAPATTRTSAPAKPPASATKKP